MLYVALAFFSTPSNAQVDTHSKNKKSNWIELQGTTSAPKIQEKIQAFKDSKTVAATVMFVYSIKTDPPRDEPEFIDYACKYPTSDARQISELEDIVRSSKLTADSNSLGVVTPVAAIYLKFSNNQKLKIIINNSFSSNDPLVAGVIDDDLVIMDSRIVRNLYRWAGHTGIKTYCDELINKYGKK